jgi:hypothetical protein
VGLGHPLERVLPQGRVERLARLAAAQAPNRFGPSAQVGTLVNPPTLQESG